MRLGFIADVHANIVALEAVLKDIEVDRLISLGDVIGYYSSPNECMDLVRDSCDVEVLGNHEDYIRKIINKESMERVSTSVYLSAPWTMDELTAENLVHIESLEKEVVERDFHFSHNGNPSDWGTYFTNPRLILKFNNDHRYRVFGHRHNPDVFSRRNGIWGYTETDDNKIFDLSRDEQSFISVPSVGMPRDYRPLAGYAILDTQKDRLTIRRVEYDIDKMIGLMRSHPTYSANQIMEDSLIYGGDISSRYAEGDSIPRRVLPNR